MERDFEICFIGREGAAAWARGHEIDWTQEMLNSDVKRLGRGGVLGQGEGSG